MFGHKHEWHQIDYKSRQEDRPHGNHGFVRTIYFNIEQCCKCGEKRKDIYNDWIHKPENDPEPNDKYTANHACIMVMVGLGHEPIERGVETKI